MRLKCIKLAGFKSFVDPTTVPFPTNMSGIVGPNGCGKSNIIDAVRWVMGESSAKNLRGESMTDVIFNGSKGRKPVGQASVELVFDNSDSTLKGEYAKYNEISIRRKVTRDAKNAYYLNGVKCRRKDITDIFLGTGLGPRSYAIISQGIVSNLIESKPEELRVFIEEAAGISKYKERRRETENRIRRTQENLERLTDLRDELDRQLQHLHRQAQAAEKYKEYKAEERLKKAQLQALKWKSLDEKLTKERKQVSMLEVELEKHIAGQRSVDATLEEKRQFHIEATDRFNEVQGRFYSLGNEISKIEQTIQHSKTRAQELKADLQQTEASLAESQQLLESDQNLELQLTDELAGLEPELELLREAEEMSAQALQEAEEAMQRWQSDWEQFNQQVAEPKRQAEVERSRIQQWEQTIARLQARQLRLREEQEGVQIDPLVDEIEILSERIAERLLEQEQGQALIQSLSEQMSQQRQTINTHHQQVNQYQQTLQEARGRYASLDALQQAALGDNGEEQQQWLAKYHLQGKPRLAEGLTVVPGWETAVETVLGDYLQAFAVDQFGSFTEALASFNSGTLTLYNSAQHGVSSDCVRAEQNTLLSKVASANCDLQPWLDGIKTADSLGEAFALLDSLPRGESIITPEGIWLSHHWLRVTREENAAAGMLARQQEMVELHARIETITGQVQQEEEAFHIAEQCLKDIELQLEAERQQRSVEAQELSSLQADLSAKKVKVDEVKARTERLQLEQAELSEQLTLEQERVAEARLKLQEAIDAMAQGEERREFLLQQRDSIRGQLDQVRQQARHDKDAAHQLALRQQSLSTQLTSTLQGVVRLQQQTEKLLARKHTIQASLEESELPVDDLTVELEALLEERLMIEEEMTEAKQQLSEIDHAMRQLEQQRTQADQQAQQVRTALEKYRLTAQSLEVQRQSLQEQLQADEFDLTTVLDNLPAEANESLWASELEKIAGRIQRLGAINLAAIEEYQTQSQRKTYLDSQNDDLVQALSTLEEAIRKIDRETKARFKETFDRVNYGLQTLFPKVFGGGSAYLELTGEDLLDTGVAIMARPPGKKNSTIHLLSGGEKALTAIALVFAIFQLNPAPFCMLDEVDAPLDDANVGRYARMVKEMSSSVQFIYITHNKIAMEAANQMMGVTMHEPGVSRLVAVDIEQAAALAAV
ncbi:chromosome segregation protein SMC [Zooshikella marina]|uniref:chromosome segregation protein SMC n=1 Tax=Zooshikella ganghwensis TaxID=202772 RepID=UPI001BAF9248|nr:chromosome segregation protein SMC [Zooshikella ganghwensis]MBU2707084.1 chromosome segregation protein SMC [Zooshikella ganghwensis]